MDDQTNIRWPDTIYDHFKRVGIRQVGYVPDAGHSRLIELVCRDPEIADVVLTTEEEGVGLVAGAHLGGQRAALLMQSSGVGNCINMFSLVRNLGIPCLVLVTMRGEFRQVIPGRAESAGPESITASAREYGFRVRELRSRPGMTVETMTAER